MTSTAIYDVVLVPFAFAILSAAKKQPCLVLAEVRPRRLRASHLFQSLLAGS